MPSSSEHSFLTKLKFFDLLLEQFSGYEGELTMAIAYLTQAAYDTDATRRDTLIRIAKQKIKHTDILRMMLLQIVHGRDMHAAQKDGRDELATYLIEQGMKTRRYEAHTCAWPLPGKSRHPLVAPRYTGNPRNYLEADIACEEHQAAVYRRLISLTADPDFIKALCHLRHAQKQHRCELVGLVEAMGK